MPALQLAHVASVCALTALEKVPDGHGAVRFAAQYQPAGHVVTVLVVVPPGQNVPAAQVRHWLGEVMPGVDE